MRLTRSRNALLSLLALSLTTTPGLASSSDPSTANEFRVLGDTLSSSGSYLEASRAYTSGIELDPTSFNLHHKRAISYLSLGRHPQALQDFENLLTLRPDYVQAHFQRAKIFAKEGQFDSALSSLSAYASSSSSSPTDTDAHELASSVKNAVRHQAQAIAAHKKKDWQGCVEHASEALLVGPNNVKLREVRVDCSEGLGDLEGLIGDLSRLVHLQPSSSTLPVKLSHILYLLSPTSSSPSAIQHLKQCLHYDPDSKPCKTAFRELKSLEKDLIKARNFVEGGSWREGLKILLGPTAIAGVKQGQPDGEPSGLLARIKHLLTTSPHLPSSLKPTQSSPLLLNLLSLSCKSSLNINSLSGMRAFCPSVLTMKDGESDLDALMGVGEIKMAEEDWEGAVRALNDAFEKSGRSSQEIMNKLQKAQRLLKQSKQKDYYKVLGVSRDADERTIKRAYRNAAKTAHPDVGGSEAKMATLNEAYEVLSNAELRQRFDNGDDPNDPTSGHQQHHGGFHHGGGQPFHHHGGGGGGGFQQHFQFQTGGGERMFFRQG